MRTIRRFRPWRVRPAAAVAVLLLPAWGFSSGSWAQDRAASAAAVAIPRPAAAAPPARAPSAAAVARARANDDMDRLRSEIRMLTELRAAQHELTEWNRLRVEAGEPAAKLDPALCGALEDWCRALPGTFGTAREGEAP